MRLILEDLSLRYGNRTALEGVTATLEGGILGLLGANASGKTSLLKILAGVQAATRGRAVLDGREARPGRWPDVSFLPQASHGFPFGQAPKETIAGSLMLRGIVGDARAIELLEATGLSGEDRPADEYSGGMQQKLRITQALAHAPRVLILDEPTTGLDTRERFRVLRLIERLRNRVSVLFSTHQSEDVAAICDQVLILHRGRAAAAGAPDALTAMARGRVHEIAVPAGALPPESAHEVSAIWRDHGMLRLRVVGDPPPGGTPVEPRLEDTYLWLTAD